MSCGGPAGLSAALVLGRCRFRVLIVDGGRPRNYAAPGVHNFLGSDGVLPAELRRRGRREAKRYGVAFRRGEVSAVKRSRDGFALTLAGGGKLRCRRLLLATGVVDPLPKVPGLAELYGISVFHCPYCDGWEVRDRPLAHYGRGGAAARYAITLTPLERHVVLLTRRADAVRADRRSALASGGRHRAVERGSRARGGHGRLARVRFLDGETLRRYAIFFARTHARAAISRAPLGVRFPDKGWCKRAAFRAPACRGLRRRRRLPRRAAGGDRRRRRRQGGGGHPHRPRRGAPGAQRRRRGRQAAATQPGRGETRGGGQRAPLGPERSREHGTGLAAQLDSHLALAVGEGGVVEGQHVYPEMPAPRSRRQRRKAEGAESAHQSPRQFSSPTPSDW